MLKLTLTLALFLGLAAANKMIGFELFDNCTNFQCFKDNNMNFVMANGYLSGVGNATSVIGNIEGANGAGLSYVDVTFYPCRQ